MAYRKKSRSSRSRSGSRSSYRPSRKRTTRNRRSYSTRGGGSRTIRLQIVQQAPQPQPMAVPGVGMVMPAGPPGKSPF